MKTATRKVSLFGAALLVAACMGGGIAMWSDGTLQAHAEAAVYTAAVQEDGTLTGFYTTDPIEGALYVGTKPSQALSTDA